LQTNDLLEQPVGAIAVKPIVYRNYLLIVLMVIQAYNYVDRQALSLALQDIKTDLHLSDTQLGLLTGIAFALFYTFMGIPIARWADRGNRVAIISLSVAVWSVAVALCSKAINFPQLLLLRAGIGVGEAGCFPPAQSLIPEYFTRVERPWANSIYMLGGPLSTLAGLFLAGWLNELYGWRTMFAILGLPGLALALLVWRTLKEPRLNGPKTRAQGTRSAPITINAAALAPRPPALSQVARTLWGNLSFRHVLLYLGVQSFLSYGVGQFQPAFLIRSYGLKTGELGTWYALIFGVSGVFGIYVGGQLASRYAANNERLQLRVAATAYTLYAFASAFAYLATNQYVAFALLGMGTMVVNLLSGPLIATLQTLVPPQMRAVSIAGIFLCTNLVGIGLGPLAVGALSDALHPWAGEESLRYALLTVCPGYVAGAWFLWRASKTITGDLRNAEAHAVASTCAEAN
jgi:MFS transporter, Spinster family, sphingosine-1-phosphate transporter